jgi:hypothetical protein
MSLSRKIVAAAEAAAAAGAPTPPPAVATEGPHTLTLDVEAASPVGVSLRTLTFRVERDGSLAFDALRAWGDRVAARVTYLMEPLVPVEADTLANELLLRSRQPGRRPGKRVYYEARLAAAGVLTLARVQFDEVTRQRQPLPCQLTLETLERLADDLVATAP